MKTKSPAIYWQPSADYRASFASRRVVSAYPEVADISVSGNSLGVRFAFGSVLVCDGHADLEEIGAITLGFRSFKIQEPMALESVGVKDLPIRLEILTCRPFQIPFVETRVFLKLDGRAVVELSALFESFWSEQRVNRNLLDLPIAVTFFV